MVKSDRKLKKYILNLELINKLLFIIIDSEDYIFPLVFINIFIVFREKGRERER